MKYGFGIDIGGMSVKIGLFDEDGNLIKKDSIKTDLSDGGKNIIPDIAAKLEKMALENSILRNDIIGAGVGVPGPVSKEGIVNKCVNLGWGVIDLKGEMENITGWRTVPENDANVAALGEYWKGSGSDYDSICFITLGTGIGGGIIIDGKIISGAHGAGGEIGHMRVPSNENRSCTCGNINCAERFSSAAAVERAFGKSAIEAFDAARAGDKRADSIIDLAADKLGFIMAAVGGVCDPECFVIGGGMSKAGDFLINKVKKYYKTYAFHAQKGTDILVATLGNDAGMYGSFKLL